MFRKKALDRLSSPEELDRLMVISRPGTSLALGAALVLILTVIIWGFAGHINDKVSAGGILAGTAGETVIRATTEGRVLAVRVKEGDQVEQGQVLAELELPDDETRLRAKRDRLKRLLAEKASLDELNQQRQLTGEAAARNERRALQLSLKARRGELRHKEEFYEEIRKPENRPAFSRQEVSEAGDAVGGLRAQVARDEKALAALDSRIARKDYDDQAEVKGRETNLGTLRDEITALQDEIGQGSRVVALQSGVISGIFTGTGDPVSKGSPLFLLAAGMDAPGKAHGELRLYASPFAGNKVTKGMAVRFSPSTVSAQEFGTIPGKVVRVNTWPKSKEELTHELGNEELANLLLTEAGGPPVLIVVHLQRQAKTFSGFAWSGGDGPRLAIPEGTLGEGHIVIRRQRPAELVLPWLKKSMGI